MRSPPPRKGEGSSGRSDLVRIQDDIFLRVVDETLTQARANPNEFMLSPEHIRVLAHDVVGGDSTLPSDHPVARETRNSIIRVMIEILNNIYKRDGPGAKRKAPMDENNDGMESDDGKDMDEDCDGEDMDEDCDGIDDAEAEMDDDEGDGNQDDCESAESDDDRDLSPQVISKGGPKIKG